MNTIFLRPGDVLFFRDGRPMGGSLSGHGAAWPLPTVTNLALHAALHRAGWDDVHQHTSGRSSERDFSEESRRRSGRFFGSLLSAGPFPVHGTDAWFFPRPLDAGKAGSAQPTFLPLNGNFSGNASSLPETLHFAVANTETASKDRPETWLNRAAYAEYLGLKTAGTSVFESDSAFSDSEFSYGIGVDPATGTQNGEQFYSASYLRLRDGWRLGCFAIAMDKGDYRGEKQDLIERLFPNHGTETPVIVGGQQRVCTVTRQADAVLPLPVGRSKGFEHGGEFLVKWTLLSPAIFPEISASQTKDGKIINPHPGGWLPSWIAPETGQVLLKSGEITRASKERRDAWRARVRAMGEIPANLVAAMTGNPVPVTGYALPNHSDRANGGAKSVHMAVPAGSVYYFRCKTKESATALAHALNWHGSGDPTTIRNRRSTLMGEKGFGLGVCSPWKYHSGTRPIDSSI